MICFRSNGHKRQEVGIELWYANAETKSANLDCSLEERQLAIQHLLAERSKARSRLRLRFVECGRVGFHDAQRLNCAAPTGVRTNE